METPKRQYRELSDETKQKISQTMRAKNIKHSQEWNQKISDSQKAAWKKIPHRPKSGGTDYISLGKIV